MHHFTIADGLPSNNIYYAFEDSKGFIWFCTDWGVSRFDGHHFETLTINNGMPDHEVFHINEDPWQRLWIGSYNGRPCYIHNGKVYNSGNDSLCSTLENFGVRYLNSAWDQEYGFCLFGNGIYSINQHGIKSVLPNSKHLVQSSALANLITFRHKEARYYLTSLNLFKESLGMVVPLVNGPFSVPTFHKGHLYLDSSTGFFWNIDLNGPQPLVKKVITPYNILSFVAGPDGTIWCCTDNGVISYNGSQSAIDSTGIIALKGKSIYNALIDKSGNKWYMTGGEGVFMEAYNTSWTYNTETGLHNNNVLSICTLPDGGILTGYNDGTVQLIKGDRSRMFKFAKDIWNRVRFLRSIKGGAFFFAGTDAGLFKVNIATGAIRQISDQCFKSVDIGGNIGAFGFRGGKGVLKYDISKDSVIYSDLNDKASRISVTAVAINNDKLWFGNTDGLFVISKGVTKKWDYGSALAHMRITALKIIKDGILLIGTHSGGLYIWNGAKLVHLDMTNGLISNICRGIYIDSHYHIWLTTDKGIDKISIDDSINASVYHLSEAEGITTNLISDIAFRDGSAYLATPNGVLIVKENVAGSNLPSRIYLTSASLKDSVLHYPKEVVMHYNNNNVQISYTGISFTDLHDLTYKYVLMDNSEDMDTVSTTSSTISLSGLKPGRYKLSIWAVGKNSRLSKKPAVLSIVVLPPFWITPWFIISASIIILIALFVLYHRKIRSIKKTEAEASKRKRKMAELEMQALRAQINPHFMFNALNAIQTCYSENDERTANYFMSSFASLIRQTLLYAKKHWITIEEEMSMLKTYIELEQLRFKHIFSYTIEVDPVLLQSSIPAMLLQIYIENAINHGLRHLKDTEGHLIISCKKDGDDMICSIDDNGVGFARAAQLNNNLIGHKSMGLKLCAERIEMINELYGTEVIVQISDKGSTIDKHGTIVEITIPQIKIYE